MTVTRPCHRPVRVPQHLAHQAALVASGAVPAKLPALATTPLVILIAAAVRSPAAPPASRRRAEASCSCSEAPPPNLPFLRPRPTSPASLSGVQVHGETGRARVAWQLSSILLPRSELAQSSVQSGCAAGHSRPAEREWAGAGTVTCEHNVLYRRGRAHREMGGPLRLRLNLNSARIGHSGIGTWMA
eukprot:1120108-Rhodomonas_salina.1